MCHSAAGSKGGEQLLSEGYAHVSGVYEQDFVRQLRDAVAAIQLPEPPTAASLSDVIFRAEGTAWRRAIDGSFVLWHLSRLGDWVPSLNQLAGSPVLRDLAADLLGAAVRPLAAELNFKWANDTSMLPWHRDPGGRLPQGLSERRVVVGVYLDDRDVEDGCLWVLPGTQERGAAEAGDLQGLRVAGAKPVVARAGDCVAHLPTVLHASGPNHSRVTRRTLYVTYCVDAVG